MIAPKIASFDKSIGFCKKKTTQISYSVLNILQHWLYIYMHPQLIVAVFKCTFSYVVGIYFLSFYTYNENLFRTNFFLQMLDDTR